MHPVSFSPPNPAAQKTEERARGIAVAYFHTFAYFQREKEAVSERVMRSRGMGAQQEHGSGTIVSIFTMAAS